MFAPKSNKQESHITLKDEEYVYRPPPEQPSESPPEEPVRRKRRRSPKKKAPKKAPKKPPKKPKKPTKPKKIRIMKSFFRSEDMELCQLLLHVDNAFDCIMELGHLGKVQFNNIYDEDRLLNNLYSRKMTTCYEQLRLVDNLHQQIIQMRVKEIFYPDVDKENRLLEKELAMYGDRLRRLYVESAALVEHSHRLEQRRNKMIEQRYAINKANKFLASDMGSELLYSESTMISLVQDATVAPGNTQLNYVIGTIRADKFYSFELLLYRMCGFNLIIRFSEIPTLVTEHHREKRSEKVRKFTLLMMATSAIIWTKVLKICVHYHVNIYDCPRSSRLREEKVQELAKEVSNIEKVLAEAMAMRRQILEMAAQDLFIVRVNLRKAAKVYDVMNRLRMVGGFEAPSFLLAECYVPAADVQVVRQSLRNASRLSGGAEKKDQGKTSHPESEKHHPQRNSSTLQRDTEYDDDEMETELASIDYKNKHGVEENENDVDGKDLPKMSPHWDNDDNERDTFDFELITTEEVSSRPILMKKVRMVNHMPPTYFRVNKFTRGFQNLIDAYGIADYKELNPAPYTIITFPFLFAVMFGDVGHGILLVVFAVILIWNEKAIEINQISAVSENEILNILFAGRYIVLLMGFFSIYMGFIYNDCMSKAVNLFGSSWSCQFNQDTVSDAMSQLSMDPSDPAFYSGDPYPFGLDPVWRYCGQDSITTTNSLKMKMAIILGVMQMMFGLFLSAANCILMGKNADLFLVVIPQIVFMTCLFGYLVFLIFFKWLAFGGHKAAPNNSSCAPSVLIRFINMMLMKQVEAVDDNCLPDMFVGERMVEYILVGVALAAVPILLAGKPLYLLRRRKVQNAREEMDNRGSDRRVRDQRRQTIKEMRSNVHYTNELNESISDSSRARIVVTEEEFDMSEIWIHSAIHTIETVLGSISHTASYLRLWALSLAHDQLSEVLWHMILDEGLSHKGSLYASVPILTAAFFFWAILTVAILVMMEGLSAFLHTLRLHWVEFQSKFFGGAGENFKPFAFPPSNHRS
ncbi:uncharacterized protein Dana_GF13738 [Drosophila ananassae]|uniref:V-type proton ATPase subunit a n=1 Tax=Drosophila ananassae TaxID=7217 RepID=B3MHZ6_DROAN|nr:V-type proton ATPase 116 kDa subunit a [Drosophila ananassae]EDV38006.2 uncharacterized protein Dana_GF13738 [Drosophila ananassae]